MVIKKHSCVSLFSTMFTTTCQSGCIFHFLLSIIIIVFISICLFLLILKRHFRSIVNLQPIVYLSLILLLSNPVNDDDEFYENFNLKGCKYELHGNEAASHVRLRNALSRRFTIALIQGTNLVSHLSHNISLSFNLIGLSLFE